MSRLPTSGGSAGGRFWGAHAFGGGGRGGISLAAVSVTALTTLTLHKPWLIMPSDLQQRFFFIIWNLFHLYF